MDTPTTAAPRARVRLRRSPLWLLAGIVAICLGGLASAFVYLSVAGSEPMLKVNRTIHRGEMISAGDLAVVSVRSGLDVRTVPDDRLDQVVGRVATSDIPAGSLLVEGTWGEAGLQRGMTRVGVRLPSGRFPAADLRPGTPLLVVALPEANADAAQAATLPGSVRSTLVAAPRTLADGALAFDLEVIEGQAEVVARLAAADRVALVQIGTGP